METIANMFQAEIIQRLGWTLVHFVWQAGAVALVVAAALRLLRKSSANLRYMAACIGLVSIVLIPAITFRLVNVSVETIEPVKQAAVNVPKAGAETQTIVEMPQVESPPVQAAASPRVSLKDKFIETVEPALPYIVVGWLVGVFGLSLWHLGGWTQLQRLRRQMVKQAEASLRNKVRVLAERLGIGRAVGLVESALVQVPTVVGHLKPVILLPASALTGLSPEQIEAILAHELAHIKRHDYLVNILQTVVEILGFYHPAVWWVSATIRTERENCCDDIAVSLCSDRVCYAKALTTMEEIRAGQPAFAVAATGGSLLTRIRRLLGKDCTNEGKLSWLPSVIAILLIMMLVIPAALALSSKPRPDSGNLRTNELVRLTSVVPQDMTIERLADICEAAGSSIVSLHISYEWYVEPPMTIEDIAGTGILINKGRPRYELLAARPFLERVRIFEWGTFVAADGTSWDSIRKSSYDGKVSTNLTIGNSISKSHKDGTVVTGRRFVPTSVNMTPLGFTILRLDYDNKPLWDFLREYKDIVVFDKTVSRINGFDCIKVELLQQQTRRAFMRIYFSAEHGYAPARYEYINGAKVASTVDITTFEQVLWGLWFPSGAIIHGAGDKTANVYSAIGKIAVNQKVSDRDFDIEFPAGTEVNDEVHGRKYIVKPTKQQKQQRAKEAEELAKFFKEHPEAKQEMERRGTSAGNLMTLAGVKDMYILSGHKELPKTLGELEPYFTGNEEIFAWLVENVNYMGFDGALTDINSQNTPLAYDRTMLETGEGTTVLFVNSRVMFVKPAQLEKLGIKAEKPAAKVEDTMSR